MTRTLTQPSPSYLMKVKGLGRTKRKLLEGRKRGASPPKYIDKGFSWRGEYRFGTQQDAVLIDGEVRGRRNALYREKT